MKKAFVTGAAGFLGYHIVKELAAQGVQVYAMCQPGSDHISRLDGLPNVTCIMCRLEEADMLPDICRERDIDVLYHLAWKGASGVLRSDYETQTDNIKWTGKMAETAVKLGCAKIVVTGTVCENQCDAILQQKCFVQSAFYLLAKRAAYEMLSRQCLKLGLSLAWCTFYHPIGTYNKPEQLIAGTILKLKQGKQADFGSGTQWFDVISAIDLAHGLFLAGDRRLKLDKYFIGSGKPRKLKEYLEEVRRIIDPSACFKYSTSLHEELPMERTWLDTGSFVNETGFYITESFREGVSQTKKWIELMLRDC